MKLTGTLAGIVLSVLLASPANAQQASQTFTLDGRLYSDTTATTPLAEAGINVKIQIIDQNQACILYEENQTVDTSSTTGYFTVQVGSPTSGALAAKRGPNDTGNTMAQVYSNVVTNVSGKLVSNSAACTYNPVAGDQRFLRVTVTPTASPAQILSPNIALDSAPSAIVAERAETLQGLLPANLLQVNSTAPADLSQGNLENIFSTTNYPRLTSLLSVPPANYLQSGANGSVGLPEVAGNPGSGLTAGQFWYDSTANQVKYYNGTAVQTLSNSSGITSLTIGSGLTPTGTITTGGSTIAVDTGTTAGQIVQVQTGGKLPALDGSNLTNLNATAIQSGTIGGTTAINTSGLITTTNTLTAQNIAASGASLRSLVLNDTEATPKTATIQAPATITANYTLTLPTAVGAANQLLQTDASGNLSWVTPAVTSGISVTAPITNSGTSAAPNIGITKADATHDGYLAQADWTTFNGKQSSALASANILVGSAGGVATAQAPSGDISMTNAGVFTVAGVKGKSVSAAPTLAGQVLRYDGTNWTPNFVAMTDLRSTVTGTNQFASSCTSSQTLTYNSVGDVMSCQNISVGASNFASQTANTVLAAPNGSAGTPTFRALAGADLPNPSATTLGGIQSAAAVSHEWISSISTAGVPALSQPAFTDISGTLTAGQIPSTGATGFFENGGNSFAASATIGTNDNNTLGFKTNGTVNMTMLANGNVGIGTTAPTNPLSFTGQSAQEIWMERETTAATAGNGFTIQAGGAVSGGSNLTGGNLNLSSGIATGNGSSNIYFKTYGLGASGTTDSTAYTQLALFGGTAASDRAVEVNNSTFSTQSYGNEALGVTTSYSNGTSLGGILDVNINNGAQGSILNLYHERTIGGGPLQVGDLTGQINFMGTDSSFFDYPFGEIRSVTTGVTNGADGGEMIFSTMDNGTLTDQMTILANGNVGIGTTSPGVTLDVNGSIHTAGGLSSDNGISTFTDTINIYSPTGSSSQIPNPSGGAQLTVSTDAPADSNGAYLQMGTDNGAGLSQSAYMGAIAVTGGGTYTPALVFGQSTGAAAYAERMRIDQNGLVGIGTTSPSYLLDVNGTARATNFISTSDRRLKTNIHPIGGLSVVTKLNGVQFNWIKTGAADLGVIAQEVEAVLPDAVVTDANGYKAVKYPNLIAPLIESTKDLYGMCKATEETTVDHERRIAALESANKQLEATNSQLQATNLQLQGDNNALKARLDTIEQKLGLQK